MPRPSGVKDEMLTNTDFHAVLNLLLQPPKSETKESVQFMCLMSVFVLPQPTQCSHFMYCIICKKGYKSCQLLNFSHQTFKGNRENEWLSVDCESCCLQHECTSSWVVFAFNFPLRTEKFYVRGFTMAPSHHHLCPFVWLCANYLNYQQ